MGNDQSSTANEQSQDKEQAPNCIDDSNSTALTPHDWSLISSFSAMSGENIHHNIDDESLSYSVSVQQLSVPGESLLVGSFDSTAIGRVDDSYDDEDDSSMGDYESLAPKTSVSTQCLARHHLYLNAMCLAYARRREECGGSTEDVLSTDLEHLIDDSLQPKEGRPYPADIWQTWSSWRNEDGSSQLLSEVLICNIQQDALDEFVYAICLAPQLDMVTVVLGASTTDRRLGQGFTEYDFHNTTVGVDGCWAAGIIGNDALFETILELVQEHSCTRLSLVGYGGGAALATVCSLWMSQRKPTMQQFNSISVFTFGCPHVGDDRFAKLYHRVQEEGKLVHIRFANEFDTTTRRPRLSWEGAYYSVGLPILFRDKKARGMTCYWQHLQNWDADKPLAEWYPMITKQSQQEAKMKAKRTRQWIVYLSLLFVYVPLVGLVIYHHSQFNDRGATNRDIVHSSLTNLVKSERNFCVEREGIIEEANEDAPTLIEGPMAKSQKVASDDHGEDENAASHHFETTVQSMEENHEDIALSSDLEQHHHVEKHVHIQNSHDDFEDHQAYQIETEEPDTIAPAQQDMSEISPEELEDDVQEIPSRVETAPQVSPDSVDLHTFFVDTTDANGPLNAVYGAHVIERESKLRVFTKTSSMASTDSVEQVSLIPRREEPQDHQGTAPNTKGLTEIGFHPQNAPEPLINVDTSIGFLLEDNLPGISIQNVNMNDNFIPSVDPTGNVLDVAHRMVNGGSVCHRQIHPEVELVSTSIENTMNDQQKQIGLLDVERPESDHGGVTIARQLQQALQESAGVVLFDHPLELFDADEINVCLGAENLNDLPILPEVLIVNLSVDEVVVNDQQEPKCEQPSSGSGRHVTLVPSMHSDDQVLGFEVLVEQEREGDKKQNVTGMLTGQSKEAKFASRGGHDKVIAFRRTFGVPRTTFGRAKYWPVKPDRVVTFLERLTSEHTFERWATEKWHHNNPSVCTDTEKTASVMVQEAFKQAGVHIEL